MADYNFDVQKLYIEMMLADAESFARAQNIFNPLRFVRLSDRSPAGVLPLVGQILDTSL